MIYFLRFLQYALYLPLLIFLLTTFLLTTSASASARIVAVDDGMCTAMRHAKVLHKDAPVRCAQLSIVHFSYLDFDGKLHRDGEIMVMAAVAEQVQAIFDTLLQRKFAIAHANLMQRYRGDDAAAMHDNNTSAFNDRRITNGSAPSLHAYGLAIDINPIQNPYLQFEAANKVTFLPAAGRAYANRQSARPGKTVRKGMAEEVVNLFAEHGFTIWGGDWDAPIDYQHFQVSRTLAKKLAALPNEQARNVFNTHVTSYRHCLAAKPANTRIVCAN